MSLISVNSIAMAFKVIGALIGLPSLAVLVLYVINEVHRRFAAPPGRTNFGDNPDALLAMLKVMTDSIGALSRLAGWLGQFLFNGLAVVAVFGLALALALWFTSWGLQAHAAWARVSACLLFSLALLVSLLLALSLHNVARVVMLVLAAICVLGLRALWLNQVPQSR